MKPATTTAAIILAAISILQLLRVLLRIQVTVAGRSVPIWPSGVACLVAGMLAVMLWREARTSV